MFCRLILWLYLLCIFYFWNLYESGLKPRRYSHIELGFVHEGLQALTAGATQQIDLDQNATDITSGVFWDSILNNYRRKHLQGAGSNPISDNGSGEKTNTSAGKNDEGVFPLSMQFTPSVFLNFVFVNLLFLSNII